MLPEIILEIQFIYKKKILNLSISVNFFLRVKNYCLWKEFNNTLNHNIFKEDCDKKKLK